MAKFTKSFNIPGKNGQMIYQAISENIEKFLSKTPIGEHELKKDDAKKEISFKASMASGTIRAQDDGVHVDISLSLLATPFKGKLEEGINKWLSKTFGIT